MTDPTLDKFHAIEVAFNDAVVSNDTARIAGCTTEDWVLVSPHGIFPRAGFLDLVGNGTLSHDMMQSVTHRVKVYGDTALVTSRGQNTGMYQGKPMSADEWITSVYRKAGEAWLCVLTHLAPAKT